MDACLLAWQYLLGFPPQSSHLADMLIALISDLSNVGILPCTLVPLNGVELELNRVDA